LTGAVAGRVAFLGALEAAVSRAVEADERLAVAVIQGPASGGQAPDVLREDGAGEVYAVGPGAYAIVLPRAGRAEALGVLAKVEARCGAVGAAVERSEGESALELYVRLLSGGRPRDGADHR
jgi:sarcosine oxidase gamma subunit